MSSYHFPLSQDTQDILTHLWRGGTNGYFWTMAGSDQKFTAWRNTSKIDGFPPLWLENEWNIYFGVNPTNAPKTRSERVTIGDVSAINAFFGEFDAKDFAGGKPETLEHIHGLPVAPTLIIDSGGGYHCYWFIDEPVIVTDDNRNAIKNQLYAWVDFVGSDKAAKDLCRVLRVPQTFNFKPKYAPNFPQVQIIEFDRKNAYSHVFLLSAMQYDASTEYKPDSEIRLAELPSWGDDRKSKYFRSALSGERDRVAAALNGERNHTLFKAAARMGEVVAGCGMGKGDAESELLNAAIACGLGESEAKKTITSGLRHGLENPRQIKDRPLTQSHSHSHDSEGGDDDTEDDDEWYSSKVEKRLKHCGFNFALNLLDSTIEVNGHALDDVMESHIFSQMRNRKFKDRTAIRDVFTVLASNNAYHPVKQYLESLTWDGNDHIRELANHISDSHDPIVHENGSRARVSRVWLGKWLIGTVAKVFANGTVRAQPPMLVLDGEQNLGKSTFALWLGSPLPKLFIESDIRPDDPEHKRYLATKWIWEVGELGSTTKKADREALKRFITQAETTFRVPYARNGVTKPVLASFIGTVNNELGFLNDPTGNRRYLCVNITRIDHSYQKTIDINQIWAQAYALYKADADSWRLTPAEMAMQNLINGGYTQDLPLSGWILQSFAVDPNDKKSRCTTQDVVKVLQDEGVKGETRAIEMKVAETLRAMGVRQDTNARPRAWVGVRRISAKIGNVDGLV